MRASTRLRVSAPTSAHPLTTLDTVITLTLRSRAMSFKRTGVVGALAMAIGAPGRAARCSASRQQREYTKLRQVLAGARCGAHRRWRGRLLEWASVAGW